MSASSLLTLLFALCFFVFGVLSIIVAKSDIQWILAVLSFGFGSMLLALNAILQQLRQG